MGTTAKKDTAKTKKIVSIVLNVILWIFLAFAFVMMVFAFASISNDYGVPIMGDKVLLNVVSDSMQPTIDKGDLIVGKVLTLEEKTELKEGDVITFFSDLNGDGVMELNTHRIVKVTGEGQNKIFTTRGDNDSLYNEIITDDRNTIRIEDVVCTWKEGDKKIRGMGSFLGFLQSRVGFLCIVVIPLALFFIYEVVRFILIAVKVKNGDKRVITTADEEEIRRKAVEDYLRTHGGDNNTESNE